MANGTGPQVAFYGAADMSFGYPAGMTVVDLVPDDLKHLVHEHWGSFPPVNPMWHYLLGTIYIVLGGISIAGNSIVIHLYLHVKNLQTPANLLIVNLACSDMIMLTTNFPPFAYNCFSGGIWMFSGLYCEIYAALGGVTGVCSIWSLVMISYDRYNIICHSFSGPKLTMGKARIMCLIAWIISIGWCLPPFFGWGHYTLEGILDSCSFDYLSQDFNNKSYNMCIFFFDFCLPAFTIVCSYIFIVKAIFVHEAAMREQAKKMNVKNLRSNEAEAQRAEIRIAKTAIANVCLWLCCWSPYAIITVQGMTGYHSTITPLLTTLPALLAKSASCYNPFVYAISHPKYRLAISEHMPWFCVHEEEKKYDDNQTTETANTEKT